VRLPLPRGRAIGAAIFLALCDAAAGTAAAGSRTLGTIDLAPCDLSDSAGTEILQAECGTLKVPENPAAPGGTAIGLKIALVRARATDPPSDPVFFLAGGPGQSALGSYPSIAGAFERIREKRHIVLVDQRGTGGSNRLACRELEEDPGLLQGADDLEGQKRLAHDCLADLPGDPRFYTTSDAVRDLEAVRVAIGAPVINLVGGSYGTRVAQEYLRRHPETTRSVILDGVAPAEVILGADHAKNLDAALAAISGRCAGSQACRETFGDPLGTLRRLLTDLRRSPRTVTFTDPKTGATATDTLTADGVRAVARLFAYQPETAAILPLVLHEAAQGRPQALVAHGRLMLSALSAQIAHGMQLSVMCTEDAPFLKPDPDDTGTVLGPIFVEAILAQCASWPRGALPEDFHRPVVSDRPVLILSGELDPVTPPRYGDQVLKELRRARHLVVPNVGHIAMMRGCMPRLAAQFIDTLDPQALDATCLDRMPAVPAFVTHNGWKP